ncbi:MAG: GNAT family N-acetyltransferase [Oscillospiraceae bacterium]|nr:GNAT family N-acetyltransferase [Oscillospiraceae bacterium]
MIFLQHFKELLINNPKIALAFDEFKPWIKEFCEKRAKTDSDAGEFYRNAISNFMHGAFRCIEKTEVMTSYDNLRLRTANIDDYDFIDIAERDKDSTDWVGNWPLGLRIEKFGDNNFFQAIVETDEKYSVGFIDFRDMLHDTQVELKRIVITEKGKGYGKKAMYLSQKFAFEVLNKEKLYLGTKDENLRAQHVYHSTGFTLVNPEHISSFHILKKDYFKMIENIKQ